MASRKAPATTPALRPTSAAAALCTMPAQASALAEIRRVFKPGGRMLSLEHVRSDDFKLPRWQERADWPQSPPRTGCNGNWDTLAGNTGADFAVEDVEHDRLKKARSRFEVAEH